MMLTKQLFITGTDTDCGKTYISKNIITSLAKQNYQVKGLKPIASGAQIINGEFLQVCLFNNCLSSHTK